MAARGNVDHAEDLARAALTIVEGTDMVNEKGDVWTDLADVLRASARTEEAADAIRRAVRFYEQKGNLAQARGAARLLEDAAPR